MHAHFLVIAMFGITTAAMYAQFIVKALFGITKFFKVLMEALVINRLEFSISVI